MVTVRTCTTTCLQGGVLWDDLAQHQTLDCRRISRLTRTAMFSSDSNSNRHSLSASS